MTEPQHTYELAPLTLEERLQHAQAAHDAAVALATEAYETWHARVAQADAAWDALKLAWRERNAVAAQPPQEAHA